MTALRGIWLVCAFAAVLAGCKPAPGPAPAPAPAPAQTPSVPPVKVGLFLPLSGPQWSFGRDALRGAELARDEINAAGGLLGRPVEFVLLDTRSDLKTAGAAPGELAAAGAVALIGEIASPRSVEAARAAQALGKPMVTPASTHQDVTAVGDFVFRACYADPFQGTAMADFASSIQAARAAIIREQGNPYSEGLADSFRARFLANGGTVVAEEIFRAGDLTFARQLEAVRAAKPDVIFLPSYYVEAALLIREARQMGIDAPFLGGDGWDSEEFLRVAGAAADNCYSANHFSSDAPRTANAAFIAAFQTRFGEPPPPLAALTYDTVRLVADAVGRAGSEDAAAIKDALASTSAFPGLTGPITPGPDRNPGKPAVILRVQDGKFSYLETVEPH